MESENLKKTLKDPEPMEIFIWTLLVEKRESTDDHEMGGMKKNELRHYAKDYTYAKFKRAVKELEDACIKMLSLQSCNPKVVRKLSITRKLSTIGIIIGIISELQQINI